MQKLVAVHSKKPGGCCAFHSSETLHVNISFSVGLHGSCDGMKLASLTLSLPVEYTSCEYLVVFLFRVWA